MIHLREVTKVFKSDLLKGAFMALDNVSFSVPEGSMVGFLGANGAGKTTSLKIIMDFIRPTSGVVEFSESLGEKQFEVFKKIGFLPERPYFYPNLTGFEFLCFLGRLSEVRESTIKDRINYWSPRFRINHALSREIKTYSKGMLQRIGFLATILHDPKLIILDEPLSGLDPIGRKELKDVIVDVHKEGKTVFFSSHIVPDIEEICDRVVFLQNGKLTYDGKVGELLAEKESGTYILKISRSIGFKTPLKGIKNLDSGEVMIEVEERHKRLLIEEVASGGLDILSLAPKKPSLEEIFYNIRE